jgi:ABC-type protease/lipase transport system fused ATPase/permease subunit
MMAIDKATDMNRTHYALAGWLAIAQAVLLLPQIAFVVILHYYSESYPVVKVVPVIMKITGLAVGIYVLYIFKRLLNERFAFHKTDILIYIFIGANVVFFMLGIIGLIPSFEMAVAIAREHDPAPPEAQRDYSLL